MASCKIFISFAVLVACIVAIQAEPVQYPPVAPSLTEPKVESSVTPANLEKDGSNRDKKHAIFYDGFGYHYPAAAPIVSTAYHYQYHRALTPYAYSAAYYPYAYSVPAYYY